MRTTTGEARTVSTCLTSVQNENSHAIPFSRLWLCVCGRVCVWKSVRVCVSVCVLKLVFSESKRVGEPQLRNITVCPSRHT